MADEITDYEISDAMMAFGGSFVSALGALYRSADRNNQVRIKTAWPEYWEQYREVVQLQRAREARA